MITAAGIVILLLIMAIFFLPVIAFCVAVGYVIIMVIWGILSGVWGGLVHPTKPNQSVDRKHQRV